MKNFWTGNNRVVEDESTYGAVGAIIAGVTSALSPIAQAGMAGTELCGARPLFAGKSRKEWEECQRRALEILQQQGANQAILTQQQLKTQKEIEKSKKTTTIVVVSLVSVAVLVAIVILVSRSKKKA